MLCVIACYRSCLASGFESGSITEVYVARWHRIKLNGGAEARPVWKEFKEFALKGNVIDLAIGVVIGGAFGKIVSSMVNDLIMPLVSLFTGRMDFTNWFVALDGVAYKTLEEAKEAGAATLNYGNFLTVVVDFLIIAFALFLIVKQINRARAKKAAPAEVPAEPTAKVCPFCQSEISVKAVKCPHCTSDLK